MQWLTPTIGLLAAAISLPLLLLLYFLKLKRQEEWVASTFLWQRAVRDLQVNAPFQRLRKNLLLLLQFLALLMLILALGGPVLSLVTPAGERTVILIDHSASMNALDGDDKGSTRLEAAKEQARVQIESLLASTGLGLRSQDQRIMIVAFARHAQVMCNFTTDRRQLMTALEAIGPTDEEAVLQEAISVAQAFAQSPGEETNNRSAENPAQLILFSDGGIRDLEAVTLETGELRYQVIGQKPDNIGITSMQARRAFEKPEEVHIFALLHNHRSESVTTDVQISLDEQVVAVKAVRIPAAEYDTDVNEWTPGSASLNLVLDAPQAQLLEIRQLTEDLLAADDVARAVLTEPHRPKVLLVTAGNQALETALKACNPESFEMMSPADYNDLDPDRLDVEQPYDVTVLDNLAPKSLARGRFLGFGSPPPQSGLEVTETVEDLLPVDWRRRHPVLRHVNLARVFVAKGLHWELPREATVLAEFTEGPAVVLVQREQRVFLQVGFDVLQSNWPFEPSFVLFCYNALEFLSQQGQTGTDTSLQPGDPLMVTNQAPEQPARLFQPTSPVQEVVTDTTGTLRWANTSTVGFYRVTMDEILSRTWAVNLLNEKESAIRPLQTLVLAGETVVAEGQTVQRANIPLWPWLAGLGLILVCGEWLLYNSRMRL